MKSLLSAASVALLSSAPAFAQAPANDNFASATIIPTPGTVSGTNVNATSQAGEPSPHFQNAAVTGSAPRTVWFTWTPAESGLASISLVAQGTGTAAGIMHANAYLGAALSSISRIGSTTSSAGAAGPPATPGTARPGNLFAVTAGTPVRIQVSGNSTTAASPFDLTITTERHGRVVLPFFSNWDWLHPINGENPTTDASWNATWKLPGNTSSYNNTPALAFSLSRPAPFGFGGIDLAPGTATSINTAATGANNNAAYFRSSFTLTRETSNLWAQILADDGAYIYIDNLPGIPVHIAATLTNTSFTTSTAHNGWRPQAPNHLTGAIPAASAAAPVPGCRAYTPTGFDNEKQTRMVFLGGLTGRLAAGNHRIAVSVHQNNNTSSDMGFALSLLDLDPRPLPPSGLSISFTDVPWVNGSTTATVIPVAEHHFAPSSGQSDLAWFMVSPTLRGTTDLSGGCVVSETLDGSAQKVLRLRDAEASRFVTEPVSVSGLATLGASIRVRTNDSSSGFETLDNLRVFIELSSDGVNFAEPSPPAELVPLLSGAALLDAFRDQWHSRGTQITTSGASAARLVIQGGTDSTNETIWFDDATISPCLVTAAVSSITYDNKADNDRSNDAVSFTLTVDGAGTSSPQWTTSGFGPGSEVTSTFGTAGALTITRPATDAAGVPQNISFRVEEQGNPSCFSNVSVTIPTAVLSTTFAPTGFSRLPGADAASPDDDLYSFSITPAGTALGNSWEARSSDAANSLLGTGPYGSPTSLSIPVSTTAIVIIDQSDPTIRRTIPISPTGLPIAMGRNRLAGSSVIYSLPGTVAPVWRQASAPATGDTEFPIDSLTSVFNLARVAVPGEGLLESASIPTAGFQNVSVLATLRAFENSVTSGFESNDTFRLEVELTREGGLTERVNLITGLPADKSPADSTLNGFTAATTAEYTAAAASDEFNAALATGPEFSRGTFTFVYSVPADVLSIRILADATSNSANEFLLLKDVAVLESLPGDADADGLPDAWELLHFATLAQSPSGDPDGDGQSNAAEFAAGTLPADGTSALAIQNISIDPVSGHATLSWTSSPGLSYQVQRAQRLDDPTAWSDLNPPVTASGPISEFTDTSRPPTSRSFYRVRLLP